MKELEDLIEEETVKSEVKENAYEKTEIMASDSEYTDSRSLILKEYLRKYIISGIDDDIAGETLLTHSSYLNDNDVMIIQWIKHMCNINTNIKDTILNEKAFCMIVNYADKKMQDLQMNAKDVNSKEMESIMKKSIKYVSNMVEKNSLVDYSNMKWYIKLKNKILEYFYKK